MVDHYVWGAVSRISPEAPVPIVHVERESVRPGGAANVYANVLSLGGRALLCGVIGADDVGATLREQLHLNGKQGIFVDPTRPTTKKTRIIAHSQQVVRYDVERRDDVSSRLTKQMVNYVEAHGSSLSCVVVSDYCKGVVTPSLMAQLRDLARRRPLPIIVDPKVEHLGYYDGVTVVTPNHVEAQQASGRAAHDHEAVHRAGHHLRRQLG